MLLANKCPSAFRSTSLFFSASKVKKIKSVPNRLFFKWNSIKPKISIFNKEKSELKPLSGPDDENFSEYLEKYFFDLNVQKEGFKNLMAEFKRFYNEEVATKKLSNLGNYEIPDPRRSIRILHKFETPDDLKNFSVKTDSSYLLGHSSASFKLSSSETAVFAGDICTDIPKTGTVNQAGYASLLGPKKHRAFFRIEHYDWEEYTHLVFKIRGDGRTYLVLLHQPNTYTETSYWQYGQPLYTRGGPYWQIAKMPFSHFYLIQKGKFSDEQDENIPLSCITHFSLTVGAYDGPFKLEIDYIGLEHKEYHNTACPYEMYSVR